MILDSLSLFRYFQHHVHSTQILSLLNLVLVGDNPGGSIRCVFESILNRRTPMWKFVAASLILVLANAVASADEFVGFITRFEDSTISVKKSRGTEPPEEVTLKLADNVKIVR